MYVRSGGVHTRPGALTAALASVASLADSVRESLQLEEELPQLDDGSSPPPHAASSHASSAAVLRSDDAEVQQFLQVRETLLRRMVPPQRFRRLVRLTRDGFQDERNDSLSAYPNTLLQLLVLAHRRHSALSDRPSLTVDRCVAGWVVAPRCRRRPVSWASGCRAPRTTRRARSTAVAPRPHVARRRLGARPRLQAAAGEGGVRWTPPRTSAATRRRGGRRRSAR